MTWAFSISPEIPGLEVVTDGDNKATLQGHPLYAFTGLVTITATNGAVTIDSVLQLDLVPLSKVAIAAIENNAELTDKIAIESHELKATVLQGRILVESVPIVQSTLLNEITFTSD